MSAGRASPAERPRERRDARRNRSAIVSAAAQMLRDDPATSLEAVAAAAGVSRSTLYRHFPTRSDLERALRDEALAEVRLAIVRIASEERPALAVLRRLVETLVETGAEGRLEAADVDRLQDSGGEPPAGLLAVLERVRRAAELVPAPPRAWLRAASAHFLAGCLAAGSQRPDDPRAAADRLFRSLTDPLDQGLVFLEADGSLMALNPRAQRLLSPSGRITVGERLTEPRLEVFYEDGSACPPEAYPLSVAVRTGEAQTGAVRGHRLPDGELAWIAIEAFPLVRRDNLYGFVGVLSDVTAEKGWELERLRPAGQLGRAEPVPLDVVRVLDEVPPHLFPEQLVSEARRLTGAPVALYVLDIDGTHLLRLAGTEEFPPRIEAPLALGPELAEDGIPELRGRLESELPGVVLAPMWLRGRAVGILLALRAPEAPLTELARLGAAAMELARGYTDVIDAASRRKETAAAAEIQQSLLPPRIARMGGGEVAGAVLPSYEVGGDWFDYVENPDGAWLALADAAGKGPTAGGLGGVALAALRAARRSDQSIEEAVQTMHEVVHDLERPEFFLTAIVARWHAVYSVFSWVNCGHPPPLLVRPNGGLEVLARRPDLPLGLVERTRRFRRHQRRLEAGERLILYSDGISARKTADGLFGVDGIVRAARDADSRSATATARSIQEAVMSATTEPLQDDAVVVVLAATRDERP